MRPSLPPGPIAHPSLWHIQGEAGQVYLLGSVHVLPPNVQWKTGSIYMALSRSDVFVFEVAEDAAAVKELNKLVQAHGFLPPDQTLRGILHPQFRADYDAAVKSSGLEPATVERERPWLAGIQMMFAQIAKLRFAASNGVDSVLMESATRNHRQIRSGNHRRPVRAAGAGRCRAGARNSRRASSAICATFPPASIP